MKENNNITKALSHLEQKLKDEILNVSEIVELPKNSEILRVGQYIKVIPIVIEGLIKVYTRHDDRELLLYYIKPNESCIMSFSAGSNNVPSQVFACTEEKTTALLLPVEHVSNWIKKFPNLNTLFFHQYNLRYLELLDTIHHVLFDKMDKRLYHYLQEKVRYLKKIL